MKSETPMTIEEFKSHCLQIKPQPVLNCRLWDKGLSGKGYAGVWIDGKMHRGNRVILSLKLRRKIRKGFQALHTCDNRRCVEEKHIYEGTPKNNIDERTKRNRHRSAFGSENGKASHLKNILKPKTIKAIKALYAKDELTYQQIGKKYGLSRSTVCKIILDTHWSVRGTAS